MMTILPFVAWLLCWRVCHQLTWLFSPDWRQSLLMGTALWGVILTAMTEVLSALSQIQLGALTIAWSLVIFSLAIYVCQSQKSWLLRFSLAKLPCQLPLGQWELGWELCGILGIGLLTLIIALTAPPNNADSISYHMVRVVHWQQNRSIAHYATPYLPQVYHGPWAEWVILHLKILWGSDRLAGLVQWFSMIMSLAGVSLLAKRLGANLAGQVFAAVFCATLPMGILQATSTKNNYVVALWLLALIDGLAQLLQNDQRVWRSSPLTTQTAVQPFKKQIKQCFCPDPDAHKRQPGQSAPEKYLLIYLGSALGLAMLTKVTAYLFVLPFLGILAGLTWKRYGWRCWQPLLCVGAVALLLNINHYLRNLELFGYPWFAPGEAMTNTEFSLRVLLSNILRNTSLHWVIPYGPWLEGLQSGLAWFHHQIGLELSDMRTTSAGLKFDLPGLSAFQTFEDVAGNPLHLLLFLWAIGLVILRPNLRRHKWLMGYLTCVIVAYLLFCGVLKWQPWHSRIHLSLFVLIAPIVGYMVSLSNLMPTAVTFPSRWRRYLVMILLQLSCIWLGWSETRPIVGTPNIFTQPRIAQYFATTEPLREPYQEAVNFVTHQACDRVGLLLRKTAIEYPLWVIFRDLLPPEQPLPRLEHLYPDNSSAIKTDLTFVPCAIIATGMLKTTTIYYQSQTYQEAWINPGTLVSVKVFLVKNTTTAN